MTTAIIQNFHRIEKFRVEIDVHKQFSLVNVYSLKIEKGMEYIFDKTMRFEKIP
ncbi:MAG: hypothetical protein ACFFD2_13805 [Promethearchaeota archaeon]